MNTNRSVLQIGTMIALILFSVGKALGQKNTVYENLPVGKYTIGFKNITLTDDSRVLKPDYDYSVKKNEGNRLKKITISGYGS